MRASLFASVISSASNGYAALSGQSASWYASLARRFSSCLYPPSYTPWLTGTTLPKLMRATSGDSCSSILRSRMTTFFSCRSLWESPTPCMAASAPTICAKTAADTSSGIPDSFSSIPWPEAACMTMYGALFVPPTSRHVGMYLSTSIFASPPALHASSWTLLARAHSSFHSLSRPVCFAILIATSTFLARESRAKITQPCAPSPAKRWSLYRVLKEP
mmetsp:Transcript_64557/g.127642  ORF Transcript_64557/g.127642 Transcript_64557/m.127642 type:complete len:218 (+) Transcript_64557:681-1334(+)